jgi:hypothetical protein
VTRTSDEWRVTGTTGQGTGAASGFGLSGPHRADTMLKLVFAGLPFRGLAAGQATLRVTVYFSPLPPPAQAVTRGPRGEAHGDARQARGTRARTKNAARSGVELAEGSRC